MAGSGRELLYFLREEAREVDPDPEPGGGGTAGRRGAAPAHQLTARLNQMARFSLNYLTLATTTASAKHR